MNDLDNAAGLRIEYHAVSKFYGDVLGVMNVSLVVEPGVTGLLGPNGAGKSTLIRLTTGLAAPDRGDVRIAGRSTWSQSGLGALIGYVNDQESLPEFMTARTFVRFLLGFHGFRRDEAAARADRALERVGLVEAADRRIRTYSKGMRQRLKLAQALAHDPPILILDEPLTGLDPVGRRALIRVITELGEVGRTILVSSHVLHEIESMTDRVALIRRGQVIASGEVQALRSQLLQVPYRLRISTAEPRALARRIIALDTVDAIHVERDSVIVSTTAVDSTLERLTAEAAAGAIRIDALGVEDMDLEALFRYTVSS